jgi:DNA repair protein RecO (recombination protein O)
MYIKDQAIVLSKRSADDASSFYILYTQKRGLQKVKVRGAKKSLSKLAGHLEPPALNEIFVALGRKVNYIAGANLLKRFDLNSLEKYKLQFWLVKLLLQIIRENSGEASIWILLNKFYNRLEKTDSVERLNLLKNIFLWQIGFSLGFMPDFKTCFICDQNLRAGYLDLENGQIFCENCRSQNCFFISAQIISLLQFIYENDLEKVFHKFKDFKFLPEFEKISAGFWQQRFEINL